MSDKDDIRMLEDDVIARGKKIKSLRERVKLLESYLHEWQDWGVVMKVECERQDCTHSAPPPRLLK